MKKTLLYLSFLAPGIGATAQNAIDFTFTDTHGVEHNLFTELDAGKTIMLDFFFTTCGPCQYWAPSINHVYEQFGSGEGNVDFWSFTPSDNDAAVLAYEATFGIEFPSCSTDGGSMNVINLYTTGTYGAFVGYPTYVVICPDRSVTWDVWPISENAPEIAAALEACGAVSIDETEADAVVSGIYPNPASSQATLAISMRHSSMVNVEIFDMLGNQVRGGFNRAMPAGNHMLELPVSELAEGAYLARIMVNGELLSTSRLIINR